MLPPALARASHALFITARITADLARNRRLFLFCTRILPVPVESEHGNREIAVRMCTKHSNTRIMFRFQVSRRALSTVILLGDLLLSAHQIHSVRLSVRCCRIVCSLLFRHFPSHVDDNAPFTLTTARLLVLPLDHRSGPTICPF